MEGRGRSTPEKDKKKRELEDALLSQYLKAGKRGPIAKIAQKVRPELTYRSAKNWGLRILKDPECRHRMHVIEQGGLMRIHELLDQAIDVISDFLQNKSAPAKVRFEAAKLVWQRIFGAVPDSVTMVKFSIFDGEDKRSILKDQIKRQIEEDVIDVEVSVDADSSD